MIKVGDKQIAFAALLSSDRFVQLAKQSDYCQNSDIVALLKKSIFDYQPYLQRKLRDEDVTSMIDIYQLVSASLNPQLFLSRIGQEYLQWTGTCFVVKPHQLSSWLQLLSLVDGSWIIAQSYADLVKHHQFSVAEIANCIHKIQCPFALPVDGRDSSYADNHVHLGGHGYLGPSLLNFCLYGPKNADCFVWPKRAEYTLYESDLLSKHHLMNNCSLLADKLAANTFDSSAKYFQLNDLFVNHYNFQQETLQCLKIKEPETTTQQFISLAGRQQYPTVKRWLLYATGLMMTERVQSEGLFLLIRLCNILRNYMVVSGVGLSQFVSTSRFSLRGFRANAERGAIIDNLNADLDPAVSREFRITPQAVIGNSVRPNLKKVNSFAENLKTLYRQSLAENAHFVIHFTRSGNRADKLQQKVRMKLKKQVQSLQQLSASVTFSAQEIAEDSCLSTKVPTQMDIRKAIRGYDVAGNENELPIEVFAPALRVLRSSKFPTGGEPYLRQKRPFITVHAGEDFSHLLSGMRAIDETVVFADFQSGDRIGHGLALGVDPHMWAHRQQTAYLTLGEHLDNLVWCHQKALTVVQTVTSMVGLLQLLQEKIHYWSEYLYGEAQPPRRLFDAWLLRRNCPLRSQEVACADANSSIPAPYDPVSSGWVLDVQSESVHSVQSKNFMLWQQYLNMQPDCDFGKKWNVIIRIDCIGRNNDPTFGFAQGHGFDSIAKSELCLYEAIQDWCMEDYALKGIVLEACPTSNIYIGRFEDYHEHPVFRWVPPDPIWLSLGEKSNRYGLRKGPVRLCINTDDGALMPTTIRNEHNILKQTAIEHFAISVSKAEEWIDKIRNAGFDIFRDNHLDWIIDATRG